MTIEIYFDGACNNHQADPAQRPMGIGLAVYFDTEYQSDLSRAIYEPKGWDNDESTSNIAEWIGCVEAMKMAKDLKKHYPNSKIRVYSDSQIITNQFNKKYVIRQTTFIKYFTKAHEYSYGSGCREVEWIPRERNKQADKLSKEGINTLNLLTKQKP